MRSDGGNKVRSPGRSRISRKRDDLIEKLGRLTPRDRDHMCLTLFDIRIRVAAPCSQCDARATRIINEVKGRHRASSMDQAARDLGTRLDWVAIDHWNTEHPHVHILVRGRADDGKDLVISRDYFERAFVPAPAISSPASSARDLNSKPAKALRRRRRRNAGPGSIGCLPGKRGRRMGSLISGRGGMPWMTRCGASHWPNANLGAVGFG